ncbi:FAD/NAD(P)-binding domain-containing protein [Hymenopellis radicata]|nr:FAD/NAD(P)-binding domain-containing protein [Hymenopellis radicata]
MSKRIAVLGGGLTGLSAAFHLSRRFPDAAIRVFEKSNRVGGWVRSERVTVNNDRGDTAQMTLETGPRTIRPHSMAILELVHLLGLEGSLITVPKSAPAAQNRFIYSPELGRIECIPAGISALLRSPLRKTLMSAVAFEPFRKRNRPIGIVDEDIASFMSRRFGEKFAREFGSALIHGYTQPTREMSASAPQRAIPWVAYLTSSRTRLFSHSKAECPLSQTPCKSHLSKQSKVEFIYNSSIASIEGTNVTTQNGEQYDATHVVSTIPLPSLHHLLPNIPHLTANPSSTVTVINFVFPVPSSSIHPPGFGYLIPRPLEGYTSSSPGFSFASANFTKLTVMLGGPYPSTADVCDVLKHLESHLGKPLPEPVLTRVNRHVDCIPTPTPGHLERVTEIRKALKEQWGGRFEVAGAGVDGVSLVDCVESGRNVGKSW